MGATPTVFTDSFETSLMCWSLSQDMHVVNFFYGLRPRIGSGFGVGFPFWAFSAHVRYSKDHLRKTGIVLIRGIHYLKTSR